MRWKDKWANASSFINSDYILYCSGCEMYDDTMETRFIECMTCDKVYCECDDMLCCYDCKRHIREMCQEVEQVIPCNGVTMSRIVRIVNPKECVNVKLNINIVSGLVK